MRALISYTSRRTPEITYGYEPSVSIQRKGLYVLFEKLLAFQVSGDTSTCETLTQLLSAINDLKQ